VTEKLSPQEKIDVFASYASDVVQLPIHQVTHRCDRSFGPITRELIESFEEAHFTQLLVFIRPLALLKSESIYIDKVANAMSELDRSMAPECRGIKQRLASLSNQAQQEFRVLTDENADTLWAGSALDLIDVYLYGRILHTNPRQVRDCKQFDTPVREYAIGHANSYVVDHANLVCETLQIINKGKPLGGCF
jgi:hypothetical protein